MSSPAADRPHDLVLFGATGFVGVLTAQHLAATAEPGVRVALGGRSTAKLAALRDRLGEVAADWPLVVADTGDPASLAELAAGSRVVLSTVGPYLRYGLPLVRACAQAGTHYGDLTGEVLFVRDSADQFHEQAVATGARIVHACGFDSVPSDLGVLATARQAAADGAGELTETTLTLVSMRGGVSGGTIDSMRAVIDEIKADADRRKVFADPYALSPDRAAEPSLGAERDPFGVRRQDGRWIGPFFMGPYNSRIVRRSNALSGWSYGRRFRYQEVMAFGSGPAGPVLAAATGAGVLGLGAGLAFPPTRFLLDKVLPKPGAGPDQATRDRGHFTVEVTATTTSGARYRTTVAAQGDPGYAATAVMFGQAGLCLASDDLPGPGGVLTPATALGEPLVERLRGQGFTLRTERRD